MSIDGIPFDEVREAHLLTLLENGVPESRTLDYKRDTYGGKDADRAEFLADVSALANTSGGHLLIGMDEHEGLPHALVGLDSSLNPDDETLRLDNLARDGIQPRIPGLRIGPVRLASGSAAILVRVPPSTSRPHCVVFQKRNRFWIRGSAGKFEPDVNQLRELFSMDATTRERMRQFHLSRASEIMSGNAALKMEESSNFLLVHIFPYSSLVPGAMKVAVDEVFAVHDSFRPFQVMGLDWKVNLNGPIIFSNGSNGAVAYTQVYRNGVSEMLRPGIVTSIQSGVGSLDVVFSNNIEIGVTETAFRQLPALEALGFSAPFVLFVSLVGAGNAQVDLDNFRTKRDPIGPHVVTLDDVSIEATPADGNNLAKLLKPIFDQLANAGGRTKSVNFSPEEEWKLRLAN